MANLVLNIAKGRVVELYNNVQTASPANSALVLVVINTNSADSVLEDMDSLSAILADPNTSEVTNNGYARKVLTDADLVAFAPDDGSDLTDLDIPDQLWSSVLAGDAWTDVLVCYDPDTTGGTDADIIPLTLHDFEVTPDGRDIPLVVGANGFYRVS